MCGLFLSVTFETMKKLMIIIAVATGFVGCNNDVGRYELSKYNGESGNRPTSLKLLDTKTGDLYHKDDGKWVLWVEK